MLFNKIRIPFLIVLTNQIGAGALLPVLSIYVEERMGATTVQAMLVVAIFYLAQFGAAPWLGAVSDRWGRRPILIVSQIGTVCAYIIIYYALPLGSWLDSQVIFIPGPGLTGGLLIMLAARALDGATGGNISVAQAYVNDICSADDRTEALGIVGGATGLGYVLGPVFGGILSLFGVRAPFLGAAAITLGTLLLTVVSLNEPAERVITAGGSPSAAVWRHPIRLWLLMITFISISAFSALQNIFPIYGVQVIFASESVRLPPLVLVGSMLTFVGLVIAISQIGLIKPLAKRFGESTLVVAGNGLMGVGALGLLLAPSPSSAFLSFIPFGLGYALSLTSLQALMSSTGGDHLQGQLMGWHQAAVSLAYIGGPTLAGILYTRFQPSTPFLMAGALFLGAMLLGLPLRAPNNRFIYTE